MCASGSLFFCNELSLNYGTTCFSALKQPNISENFLYVQGLPLLCISGNLGAWPSNPWMPSMQQPDQKFSPEPASKLLKPNGSLPHHLTSTPVSSRGNSSSPIFRPIPSRGASLTPHSLPPTPGGLYSPIPTLITNNATTPTVKTGTFHFFKLPFVSSLNSFGEEGG